MAARLTSRCPVYDTAELWLALSAYELLAGSRVLAAGEPACREDGPRSRPRPRAADDHRHRQRRSCAAVLRHRPAPRPAPRSPACAADTVVWLDYSRRVVLPRLFLRSIRRSSSRERIFNGNVETWRGWLSPGHPFWHAVRSFGTRRAYLATRTRTGPGIELVRMRTPLEFDEWLAGLCASGPSEAPGSSASTWRSGLGWTKG